MNPPNYRAFPSSALSPSTFTVHFHRCFSQGLSQNGLKAVPKKVSGSIAGPPLITLRAISTKVGNPTLLHTEVGFPTAWHGPGVGLVRAWCGPGAGLARAWRGPGNPGLGAGSPQSILLRAQDCLTQSCRHSRIAPAHYQQLGLGARARPCDGAGPAVELPGFRHVVDAHKEGQAACEERVLELRKM